MSPEDDPIFFKIVEKRFCFCFVIAIVIILALILSFHHWHGSYFYDCHVLLLLVVVVVVVVVVGGGGGGGGGFNHFDFPKKMSNMYTLTNRSFQMCGSTTV